jgi:predicted amidohydrolase YtcJ
MIDPRPCPGPRQASSLSRCVGLALGLGAAGLAAACHPPAPAVEPAELVLRNGKIATVDPARPEARALAARGDAIVAVGSEEEIRPYVGPSTRVIDLEGRLAIPGFIEGHGHFLSVGRAKMQLALAKARNWEEIVAMVAEAAKTAAPGTWITGRGWHQEKWDATPEPNVDGIPFHHGLSAVSPDNPVLLDHASGHAVFANAKAMQLAGVSAATADPEGGTIVRDAAGNPTGYFRETAADLVERQGPPTEAEVLQAIDLATDECLGKGISSFQDAGSPVELVDLYRRLADEGTLRLRLWVMFRDANAKLAEAIPRHRALPANRYFKAGGIKHAIDGALGSHGGWLLEPYTDLPSSTGLNITPIPVIEESARLALAHGLQLCVHAIGDRANRETLDLFERNLAGSADGRKLRWRVEHAQHLHPDDVPRFAELGVVASMQAVHCTSDGPWVPARLGAERAASGAYVWRSLLDAGAVVSNGTDAPVEDVSPIASFYSAVARRLSNGEAFYPAQRMSREEALASYTLSAAYAAFQEGEKGSLAPGKLADVTVLDRDILTVPEEEIPATQVVYTIVGGKVAYEHP